MATRDDWLKSSRKQRRDLFEAVRRLVRLGDMKPDDVAKQALKRAISASFDENFRQGRISGADASRIYGYLQEKHKDAAMALDAQAFAGKAFNDFLLRFRRLGMIQLLPEFVTVPFRSLRLGPEWTDFPFEMADPICFRLRLPWVYDATIALNGTSEGWFPLGLTTPTGYEIFADAPLDPDYAIRGLIQPVTFGAQDICTTVPTETERRRRRDSNVFVFFVGEIAVIESLGWDWQIDKAVSGDELNALAEFLSRTPRAWAVTQINATGIGPYED